MRAQAAALDARRGEIDKLPLYGVPFAVKDNIDVAGMPTTAACPGFAYEAKASAEVVQRLVDAGAIVIGKTNLDQFATGLVGVRSPYGVPRNPFDAAYVPGGSSSGSAVAVSSGLVSFSLGTDTAGSGRVPAGFNNIVGLKPTPGLLSNEGVVPACRSLDCVSVFALSCADADAVLGRRCRAARDAAPSAGRFRFGILVPKDAEFFGDAAYATLYAQAIEQLKALGGTPVEFDYAPFRDAAQLLYNGPWVAERTAAVGAFIESADDDARRLADDAQIVLGGRKYSAVDAFEGQYELAELKARADAEMKGLDFLAVPTAGTIYRAGRSRARAGALQFASRPLHQLREFLRPVGARRAVRLPARRHAVRHHPDRARHRRARAARLRRALAARGAAAARQDRRASCRRRVPIPSSRRIASRSPWSART